MKKWIFMLLLAGSIQGIYAQKTEKKEKFNPNTPLFEELTDEQHQALVEQAAQMMRVVQVALQGQEGET